MAKTPQAKSLINSKSKKCSLPVKKATTKKPKQKSIKTSAKKAAPPDPVPPPRKPVKPGERVRSHRAKESSKRASAAANATRELEFRDIRRTPEATNYKPIDFNAINWERRLAAKADPLVDLKTYMPNVFYLPWSSFVVDLVYSIERKIQEGGKQSFGMPRGCGKTAVSRGMIARATKFGLRKFSFFVGSKEPKATQTLKFIKGLFYRSPELNQDFPELCYPIYRIDGRAGQGMHSQTYDGQRTHLNWSSNDVQFPSLLLTEEDAGGYLKHDPDCITYLEQYDRFIVNSAGSIIRVAGVDGSIRGEADIHPILLSQPRPDLVLLDDVQKDQKADSVKSCEDLERLIESAIDYLAAPDVSQATLMPCTVIRDGDVSDIYLTPSRKPEWNGMRRGIIDSYPSGMDNDAILDEIHGVPNPVGQLWLEYKNVRERSYRVHGNLKLANEYYLNNREAMDEGFEVSWPERFKTDSTNPDVNEVSGIQSAMNWRFKDHLSFLSEGQNRPRSKVDTEGLLLKCSEVENHFTEIPRNELSEKWRNLVCFIDVQDELLFYTILAHDSNFNGQFIDYGTFPQVPSTFFRKFQLAGWSHLTRGFYKAYPNELPPTPKEQSTKVRAPFDAKIYLALQQATRYLLSRKFARIGQEATMGIRALAIDTQWGKASDVVKRFVKEAQDPRITTYAGQAYMPSFRQLEEYSETDGWLFEHQQFPHVRESKWVIKSLPNGTQYIHADVNRLKSFLMKRLATPKGSDGSITLFKPQFEGQHRMFATHITESEYPEPIAARGMIKDCWHPRPQNKSDNDYLDCATGCMCLAAVCGASIKSNADVQEPSKRNMRDIYEQKRRRGAKS